MYVKVKILKQKLFAISFMETTIKIEYSNGNRANVHDINYKSNYKTSCKTNFES